MSNVACLPHGTAGPLSLILVQLGSARYWVSSRSPPPRTGIFTVVGTKHSIHRPLGMLHPTRTVSRELPPSGNFMIGLDSVAISIVSPHLKKTRPVPRRASSLLLDPNHLRDADRRTPDSA